MPDSTQPPSPPVPPEIWSPPPEVPPPPFAITRVRLGEEEAETAMRDYVEGGRYAPRPAPRGIFPSQVSMFLLANLTPVSGPGAYTKAIDLVRFYERPEIAAFMLGALTGAEAEGKDVQRSCRAIMAAGEMLVKQDPPPEKPEDDPLRRAAKYFKERLCAPGAHRGEFLSLARAGLALACHGLGAGPADVVRPYEAELASLRPTMNENSEKFNDYHRLAALGAVLEEYKGHAKRRETLWAQPMEARREALANIYLNIEPASDPFGDQELWAARLLRLDALRSVKAAGEVRELLKARATELEKKPGNQAGAMYVRACRALVYMGGAPDEPMLDAWEDRMLKHQHTDDFLLDEPGPVLARIGP
ncbi:MAG: hypothetical protein SFY95_04535 [Planctomycetota bacterium]|nr:hypothetical protein [Planctomycetota bacterium]